MKKILAKSLLVIIEAGVAVMAERIKKRRNKNGNRGGLDDLRNGRGAYGVRNQPATHYTAFNVRRAMRKRNTRRRSISKG